MKHLEPESERHEHTSACRATCYESNGHTLLCECSDKTVQCAEEAVDDMVARFELPTKRRLIEPEGKI